MIEDNYIADNTIPAELHGTDIHNTINVRGEGEQRAIRIGYYPHLQKRKSKNGESIYSRLVYRKDEGKNKEQ